jgi:hypothetical protein
VLNKQHSAKTVSADSAVEQRIFTTKSDATFDGGLDTAQIVVCLVREKKELRIA